MPLAAGTRFGPYEIVAPIGAGGMGEVYRATDTRLQRDVALKVIPEALVADPERLARFAREARVLASLNHPNIAAVYGFEPSGDSHALVMELVEGPTLDQRIAQGAMPPDEALPIALQVAEALEHAHEQGVVHRDLKPANIKLRPDGAVKVLDFGLAKALEDPANERPGSSLTQSPTMSQHMTMAGIILGTAAYMAPEQARGRAVDRRADVWALGVVLFEMLAGRQLFEGETVSETLASVMKDEVPWSVLPASTPPGARRLLERCLTRDPKQRLQSVGEARIALERVRAGRDAEPAADGAVASPRPTVPVAGWVGAMLGVAVLAALTSGWLVSRARPRAEPRKLQLVLREGDATAVVDPTLSPDGRWIAFFSGETLWVRSLLTLETRGLAPGQSTQMRPFWAPDSRSIGFCAGSKLLRIDVAGGGAVPICTLPVSAVGGAGASWDEDGTVWFALGSGGLYSAPAAGGDAREVLAHDSTASDYHEPLALPGGRVLFIRHRLQGGPDRLALYDGHGWHDVLALPDAGFARPAWSPTGHVFFDRRNSNPGLWAVAFSPTQGRVTGSPFLVATDGASASVSRAGTLLYTGGLGEGASGPRAVWVDRSGAVQDTVSEPLPGAFDLALSPDGHRAAVISGETGSANVWLLDLSRHTRTRLTFGSEPEASPAWTPDGREVLYTVAGSRTIMAMPSGGGGSPRRVGAGGTPCVSPDGRWIAFEHIDPVTHVDLYVRSTGTDTTSRPMVRGPADDFRPTISPDGRYIAYHTDESGRAEVYVTRFPSGEGRWQVSVLGGRRARWSRAGDRIFFQSPDGEQLLEVDARLGEVPTFGSPHQIFDLPRLGLRYGGGRNYDTAADGKRFLMLLSPGGDRRRVKTILDDDWLAGFAPARRP